MLLSLSPSVTFAERRSRSPVVPLDGECVRTSMAERLSHGCCAKIACGCASSRQPGSGTASSCTHHPPPPPPPSTPPAHVSGLVCWDCCGWWGGRGALLSRCTSRARNERQFRRSAARESSSPGGGGGGGGGDADKRGRSGAREVREGAAWAVWGANGPSDTPKHPATSGHTNHHPRQRAIRGLGVAAGVLLEGFARSAVFKVGVLVPM